MLRGSIADEADPEQAVEPARDIFDKVTLLERLRDGAVPATSLRAGLEEMERAVATSRIDDCAVLLPRANREFVRFRKSVESFPRMVVRPLAATHVPP